AVSCYDFFSGHSAASVFLEPAGILVAVLLATIVGFCFEVSANRKFEVLNKVNDDVMVTVIRNENVSQVPRREVVVGDIVALEAGEEVPADGELLEAVALQINESTLTGEPVARKTTRPADFDDDATYPSNHAMKGTTVADGHCIMRTLKVGDATEYGKVYKGAQIDSSVKTPLNRQLDRLAAFIAKASYFIAAFIVAGRLVSYFVGAGGLYVEDLIHFGGYILSTAMIAVTVIVVAVPEGLPMSVTLSLALSMKRMLSTNNLVRKMHACETMGATTVICTDKTGTLTQNQMKVWDYNFFEYNGSIGHRSENQTGHENHSSDVIYEGIAVNSTAYLDLSDPNKPRALGNPTEGALLLWLHDSSVSYLALREGAEVVEQLTFSTERKYMATIVASPLLGKKALYVKGAPEIVLDLCQNVPVPKAEVHRQLFEYQSKAMRTLGFAFQILDDNDRSPHIVEGAIRGATLTFLGVVAISDPVRAEAPDAVKACLNAGIDVKIVTGDTPGTAKEIARQIGLWSSGEDEAHHLTGAEFAAMPDELLLARTPTLKILSRARPMDKQRLVQLLQSQGYVVAVTGDGTNDAPALNAAQVGLSMGDGTSVAREASDITILDNSFGSISRAVMWGRSLYQNIRRFILFQMTINVAACLIVLIGAFLGTESPLTVTQMLWVNLIMDTFAALALASLPPNEEVMKDKPRRATDRIISTAMARSIVGVGAIFVFLLFGLLQYFKHSNVTSLADFSAKGFFSEFFNFGGGNGLTPYELSLFFTIFVMLQFWNMFNAKAFMSGRSAFAQLGRCGGFLAIAIAILAGQWLIVTVGGEMFSVVPLKLSDWGIIIVATSLVLWAGEAVRMFGRLRAQAVRARL
ncbi:MAG: calcium-translocating P-type ATPase, PMCA-type, partial [Prevotellaceae bacterium]|nr:calcium-translocating P-type ATPase, PMCA-type [Prevotellaceae bacterium]